MDSAVAGLLAAAVGVGGTLGSAWLTQRRSDVSRREEWDRVERARVTELAFQRGQSGREERRVAYTALNAAARHYLAALNDHAHVLRLGAVDPRESLAALDTARAEFRQRYAEAQMIVPDTVLDEVRRANAALGAVYGVLARLTGGTPRDGDDATALPAAIGEGWRILSRMRAAMRTDLDVTDPSAGA